MAAKFRKIGVLTSGGDSPGMNAAVRAVAREALSHGVEVMGIYGGYRGMIYDEMIELTSREVSNKITLGGTFLYSDRCLEFKEEEGLRKAIETLKRHEIDGVVAIGGDGTFRGATDLSARGIPTIGIPGTIDNDITATDNTIGFDTAMQTVLECVDRLRDTCESHARCNVVEVMGRGAGDIASGIAVRLHRSGFTVAMTDLIRPTSIRRTVCFSEAIIHAVCTVEGITAERAASKEEADAILSRGHIPVFADDTGTVRTLLQPEAIVDARLAKVNLDTAITDAPIVVTVGPGFTAGKDCHAVVETQRGHYLGRAFYEGSAAANTGIPGNIGGYTVERIIRAPRAGLFHPVHAIGDQVAANEIVAYVDEEPVRCQICGTLRGILPEGTEVFAGMKSGDVDPRCKPEHCLCASDKALSVGGGVLEALLHFGYRE